MCKKKLWAKWSRDATARSEPPFPQCYFCWSDGWEIWKEAFEGKKLNGREKECWEMEKLWMHWKNLINTQVVLSAALLLPKRHSVSTPLRYWIPKWRYGRSNLADREVHIIIGFSHILTICTFSLLSFPVNELVICRRTKCSLLAVICSITSLPA